MKVRGKPDFTIQASYSFLIKLSLPYLKQKQQSCCQGMCKARDLVYVAESIRPPASRRQDNK
jgi:hypothetical protein